ncbi:hypothetical protein LLY42_21115 [Pseudomonas frederiksbergensis]|nr:hypothetical protein LLY42_21115 [Pseudomonas frederiksbergensis]
MYLAIDYGDEPVEVVETSSRQIDHLIPKAHKARVSKVSLILGAALKRRAFFNGLKSLSSDELLSAESSYHEEYRRHLRDLASMPYDGYHTEYSRWESEFGEKSLGTAPRTFLSTAVSDTLAAYITGLSLGGNGEQPSGAPPLRIALINEARDEKPARAESSKGLPDQDDGKTIDR